MHRGARALIPLSVFLCMVGCVLMGQGSSYAKQTSQPDASSLIAIDFVLSDLEQSLLLEAAGEVVGESGSMALESLVRLSQATTRSALGPKRPSERGYFKPNKDYDKFLLDIPVGRRAALVIGNSNYADRNFPDLRNTANDADAIAAALQDCNFDVVHENDVDLDGFLGLLRRFENKLTKTNPEVVWFYFAGHGVQVNNINYLIPTDARVNISDGEVLEDYFISIEDILEKFESRQDKLSIVVLDACSNNPFTNERAKGLSDINPDMLTDVFMMFASKPGTTALDAHPSNPSSRNGLFTGELLLQMAEFDKSLAQVAGNTVQSVRKITDEGQYPWILGQPGNLSNDFHFRPLDDVAGVIREREIIMAKRDASVSGQSDALRKYEESVKRKQEARRKREELRAEEQELQRKEADARLEREQIAKNIEETKKKLEVTETEQDKAKAELETTELQVEGIAIKLDDIEQDEGDLLDKKEQLIAEGAEESDKDLVDLEEQLVVRAEAKKDLEDELEVAETVLDEAQEQHEDAVKEQVELAENLNDIESDLTVLEDTEKDASDALAQQQEELEKVETVVEQIEEEVKSEEVALAVIAEETEQLQQDLEEAESLVAEEIKEKSSGVDDGPDASEYEPLITKLVLEEKRIEEAAVEAERLAEEARAREEEARKLQEKRDAEAAALARQQAAAIRAEEERLADEHRFKMARIAEEQRLEKEALDILTAQKEEAELAQQEALIKRERGQAIYFDNDEAYLIIVQDSDAEYTCWLYDEAIYKRDMDGTAVLGSDLLDIDVKWVRTATINQKKRDYEMPFKVQFRVSPDLSTLQILKQSIKQKKYPIGQMERLGGYGQLPDEIRQKVPYKIFKRLLRYSPE